MKGKGQVDVHILKTKGNAAIEALDKQAQRRMSNKRGSIVLRLDSPNRTKILLGKSVYASALRKSTTANSNPRIANIEDRTAVFVNEDSTIQRKNLEIEIPGESDSADKSPKKALFFFPDSPPQENNSGNDGSPKSIILAPKPISPNKRIENYPGIIHMMTSPSNKHPIRPPAIQNKESGNGTPVARRQSFRGIEILNKLLSKAGVANIPQREIDSPKLENQGQMGEDSNSQPSPDLYARSFMKIKIIAPPYEESPSSRLNRPIQPANYTVTVLGSDSPDKNQLSSLNNLQKWSPSLPGSSNLPSAIPGVSPDRSPPHRTASPTDMKQSDIPDSKTKQPLIPERGHCKTPRMLAGTLSKKIVNNRMNIHDNDRSDKVMLGRRNQQEVSNPTIQSPLSPSHHSNTFSQQLGPFGSAMKGKLNAFSMINDATISISRLNSHEEIPSDDESVGSRKVSEQGDDLDELNTQEKTVMQQSQSNPKLIEEFKKKNKTRYSTMADFCLFLVILDLVVAEIYSYGEESLANLGQDYRLRNYVIGISLLFIILMKASMGRRWIYKSLVIGIFLVKMVGDLIELYSNYSLGNSLG